MKMMIRFPVLMLALAATLSAPTRAQWTRSADRGPSPGSTAAAAIGRDDFRGAMRRLWEDHIVWTRLYIVSAIAGLPDLHQTAERLLRNQADIGDAIKPFYGEEAGAQLTALLRGHILTAAELIGAAKTGDQPTTAAASERWYANADSIATFLSSANPRQWPAAPLKLMMKQHLDATLTEATARLQGRYAEDIAAYDRIHQHILMLADALSDGIASQFPAKFR